MASVAFTVNSRVTHSQQAHTTGGLPGANFSGPAVLGGVVSDIWPPRSAAARNLAAHNALVALAV